MKAQGHLSKIHRLTFHYINKLYHYCVCVCVFFVCGFFGVFFIRERSLPHDNEQLMSLSTVQSQPETHSWFCLTKVNSLPALTCLWEDQDRTKGYLSPVGEDNNRTKAIYRLQERTKIVREDQKSYKKLSIPCTRGPKSYQKLSIPCTRGPKSYQRLSIPCRRGPKSYQRQHLPCRRGPKSYQRLYLPCRRGPKSYQRLSIPSFV